MVPMPPQRGYGTTFAAITGLAALQGAGGQLKLMCFPRFCICILSNIDIIHMI